MPQTIALCALVLSSFSGSPARAADPAAAAVPAPTSVTTVGTLRVEKYGSGSPAMIFIPGLSSGSWVWRDAVTHYAGTHAVYLVTLAGFDGLPSTGAGIDGADASLLQLITTEKLKRPIVVGHSLGGYLALRFGTEHASLVRGIVAVDGLPILPQYLQTPAADRIAAGDKLAAQIGASTPEQYAAGQKMILASMITSPADVDRVAALSAKSDPKAVAIYYDQIIRDDLRPALPKLTVPTLEIAPVPTEPAPYEGPQAQNASLTDRAAGYKAFYGTLFPGAPNVTVETVLNSKHFAMIDQPKALYDDITAFVATLPA
ncbi:MAG: alpha/beta hydrolase [Candidatus Eremiobacteraeota bacterium]|nr:alpha/beta hydrolase [Candidatus Eremiobacteraeota bacterium]